MNLGELNQIEEGIISSLRGAVTGKGSRNTMIQDIFIKDFIQDALTSLKNAIQGGLVYDKYYDEEPQPASNVAESGYHAMNQIFENIIKLSEAAAQKKMSIVDFMMKWFEQYMKGVDWQDSKELVRNKIKEFAIEYKKYSSNKPLKELAHIALALSKTNAPAGAPQEFKQTQQSSSQATQKELESIKTMMDELAKNQPDLYNKFIKTLQPVKQELPAGAGMTSGLTTEQENYGR